MLGDVEADRGERDGERSCECHVEECVPNETEHQGDPGVENEPDGGGSSDGVTDPLVVTGDSARLVTLASDLHPGDTNRPVPNT